MSSLSSIEDVGVSIDEILSTRFPGFLHLLANWFLPPHWRHRWPDAGHFPFSNVWIPPQRRQDFRDLSYLSFLSGILLLPWWRDFSCFPFTRLTSSDVFAPEIISICDVLVSELLQMSMHLLSVSFRSCRSRFVVCGFWIPNTILSRMSDSLVHSQKSHVYESISNTVTYASKVSSGDWFLLLNT